MRTLEDLQHEQAAYRRAIEETRDLLTKADQKRLDNPHDRQRWDDTVASLERSLNLSKSQLTRVEKRMSEMDGAPIEPAMSAPTACCAATPTR